MLTQKCMRKKKRSMNLYLVRYWKDEKKPHHQIYDGLYAVRAANQEDCAKLLFNFRTKYTTAQDKIDVLERIRPKVAEAVTTRLSGRYWNAKLLDYLEAE